MSLAFPFYLKYSTFGSRTQVISSKIKKYHFLYGLIFYAICVIVQHVARTTKNKVDMGLAADSRRRSYTFGICLRGIRQMSMRAWPPDSLLRENESSVRDLPLVKQN